MTQSTKHFIRKITIMLVSGICSALLIILFIFLNNYFSTLGIHECSIYAAIIGLILVINFICIFGSILLFFYTFICTGIINKLIDSLCIVKLKLFVKKLNNILHDKEM